MPFFDRRRYTLSYIIYLLYHKLIDASPISIAARGEYIRLTLAQLGLEYEDLPITKDEMKSNLQLFMCGQCPRFVDEDVDMVQSNSILRHLGRKYNMTGADLKEQAYIDMILDTVEALRPKFMPFIYMGTTEEAKAEFWEKHVDPANANGSTGGAHFAYVESMLNKVSKDGPFVLGAKPTIADMAIFDVVNALIEGGLGFEEKFPPLYPKLMAHNAAVAALPNVAAYLASDRRPKK